MARLLPPTPAPTEPAPEQPEETEETPAEDPEIEPEGKSRLGYGWDWTAKKFATALDMGASLAIEAFTDREALDAGEDETAELERITAEYGEKRVGQIEAPTWLVFLIAIAFFLISKYAGAPRKPKALPVKPDASTPGTKAPDVAATAATKTPAAAPAAVTTETPRPIPPPAIAAGPAVDVGCGF